MTGRSGRVRQVGTEQQEMTDMFKVGDTVRRTRGSGFGPNMHFAGFVGVVTRLLKDSGLDVLEFTDGSSGYADKYELVQPAGPVRTERRIVPGVYGRLSVRSKSPQQGFVTVALLNQNLKGGGYQYLNAEELDSLAMVSSQLAEALRDA